jgi:hypothetical protein
MICFCVLFVMFSVDYWACGHLEVKEQNWVNSINLIVLQLFQMEMCGFQTPGMAVWLFCDDIAPRFGCDGRERGGGGGSEGGIGVGHPASSRFSLSPSLLLSLSLSAPYEKQFLDWMVMLGWTVCYCLWLVLIDNFKQSSILSDRSLFRMYHPRLVSFCF